MTIDYDAYDVLTFDCYGTLIDWESGIATELASIVGGDRDRDDLLALYARHEHAAETPYKRYRDVLEVTARAIGADLGVDITPEQAQRFGASVPDWPAFPDSGDALRRLHQRYRLAVITNCDDDLFAASERRLGVSFDHVTTAQQVGSYKPALANFHHAHERLGIPRERILHVAQSLYHDHAPAKQLGMTTVWINRRAARGGGDGATPPVGPDVKPDATFVDMASFADAALA